MTYKRFGQRRRFAVAVFVLSLVCICEPASAQTRSDLIESARTQKEANLIPNTSSNAERRFVQVENSLPYRLMTGDVNGLSVGFGNFAPGAGFAIGPSYRRGDLLDGRITLEVDARAATNESYAGRVGLSVKNLLGGRGFLDFATVYSNISEMPYYGPGPDSQKTGRSNYRREDTNFELRPGLRLVEGLRVGLVGSFLAVNVGQGHSDQFISTDRQFGPDVAPGIDEQTNFWRGGGFVEFDWRDRANRPTSGGKYVAQYVRYLDTSLGRYSFFRLDLDATNYLSFFNSTRVIALHGASSFTNTNATQRVPFYLQPTLGGPTTLRGYRINRFYGNNSVMVNAEYRWDLSPTVEMVAFGEGGKVFDRWEQWNLHNLETGIGFGVRFKNRTRVVFSLDTAFSHEGFQIWFRVNNLL